MYQKMISINEAANVQSPFELSRQTINVQQGLSQAITDLDTRLGSVANKATDPVLRAAIEDTKLKVQGIIGDLARAVPAYEKNKTAVLAASIKEAAKTAPDVPVATSQPPQPIIQAPAEAAPVNDQTLTESVVGKTNKFIMEGWIIEKPEASSDIEASPVSISKMSKLFSVLPKSAGGCNGIKVIISLVKPETTVKYSNQLGSEERDLGEKEINSIFWKGAINDIREEVIRRIKNAKS